jgi:hypothetical protein
LFARVPRRSPGSLVQKGKKSRGIGRPRPRIKGRKQTTIATSLIQKGGEKETRNGWMEHARIPSPPLFNQFGGRKVTGKTQL